MLRYIAVKVVGPNAKFETVVFDRYGLNGYVFRGRTDDQALGQAASDALTAVMQKHGVQWPESHTITSR